MRVIVANYRYFITGGPERYMFNFMAAAEELGIEVIPFSVQHSNNVETPYSKYFVKPRSKQLMYADMKPSISNYIGLLRTTLWNYDASSRLRKLIRETKPDVIYILHEVNHLSPSIIKVAKQENVRVVHRISDFFMFCAKFDLLCGEEVCEACLHGDYSKALEQRCVKGSRLGTLLRVMGMKLHWKSGVFDDVDHYIATCDFSRDLMIRGGILAEKVTSVYTFIDSSKIKPCYTNKKYFLFLGRMAYQKGAIYAVEAMNYLKDTEYKLKITGTITDSEDDQKIWNYIMEHGLEDKVEFTGFVHGQELADLIANSTCVVCPAIWYENMPNTVIEAYAYGKPVVASRLGSLQEMVVDGETGFLFEPKNARELSEKLNYFVMESNLSEQLGSKARKKCDVEYSKEKHMESVLKILGNA